MNKVILMGRLGKDAEIRKTNDGKPIANFSLVTNRKYKDKEGNNKEDSEWHNVVKFGINPKFGELLIKGLMVTLEGRIRTRKYQDKLGKDSYITEIIADDIYAVFPKKSDDNTSDDHGISDDIPF